MKMDKKQLRKNRLDLEYHGSAQQANAFLILLTTGMLGFLGTFVWVGETRLLYVGSIITVAVSGVGAYFYFKSHHRMKEILNEIERI